MWTALGISIVLLQTPTDVPAALAQLDADSATAREAAERWLADHAELRDLAAIAETAARAPLETRTRIAHALGRDPRHFELALNLSFDREANVKRAGREALERQAAAWFGAEILGATALADDALAEQLRGAFLGRYSVRAQEQELDDLLDQLARLGPVARIQAFAGAPLALAVDSVLYADPPDSAQPSVADTLLEGSFDELLTGVLEGRGARVQAFGVGGPHPWLCVFHAPDAGDTPALTHLWRWCREVVEYADRPRGAGAARALAACGWPAPLEWLERRWVTSRDRNALEGLLLAAARGRVALALCTQSAVSELVAAADASAESAAERSIALALARVPHIGRDGRDLSAAVLADWTDASERGRRWRANVIAGMGHASESWRARVRGELVRSDPALAPSTRLAYLRGLAACEPIVQGAPWRLAADAELLEKVVRDRGEARFLTLARRLRARPPEAWRDGRGLTGTSLAAHALAVTWSADADDDLPLAVELCNARWGDAGWPVVLGDALAERIVLGEEQRARRLCDELLRAHPGDDRARLVELYAGLASVEQSSARLTELLGVVSPKDDALLPIAATLRQEVDKALTKRAVEVLLARARLTFATAQLPDEPWIAASERAARNLFLRGENSWAARLVLGLRAEIKQHETHRLYRPLWLKKSWPPPTGPRATSLEALDAPFAD